MEKQTGDIYSDSQGIYIPEHIPAISGIIVPMQDLDELHKRIATRLAELDLSEAEMLRRASLNSSRLKPLKRRVNAPKIDALQAMAQVLQVPLWHLAEPAGYTANLVDGFQGGPSAGGVALPAKPISVNALPVIGEVQAGVWIEEHSDDLRQVKTIPVVPDPQFAEFRQYALRVRGESMNKIIRDGEFAICVDLQDVRTWVEGDIVVVVRYRDGGRLRETTLKQILLSDTAIELWPRSDDGRFQKPLQLATWDDPNIEIVALVIAKHASFR